jgi:Ca2+-binding EF-hand superfamily protein
MKHIIQTVAVIALTLGASSSLHAAKGGGKPKKTDPVEAYLKQNDKNKDGVIDKSEAHMGDETFAKWDKNRDGKLDKSELAAMLSPGKKK